MNVRFDFGGRTVLVTSSVTGPRVAYPGLSDYAAAKLGSTASFAAPRWSWRATLTR